MRDKSTKLGSKWTFSSRIFLRRGFTTVSLQRDEKRPKEYKRKRPNHLAHLLLPLYSPQMTWWSTRFLVFLPSCSSIVLTCVVLCFVKLVVLFWYYLHELVLSAPAEFRLGPRNRDISGYCANPFRALLPPVSDYNMVGPHIRSSNFTPRISIWTVAIPSVAEHPMVVHLDGDPGVFFLVLGLP